MNFRPFVFLRERNRTTAQPPQEGCPAPGLATGLPPSVTPTGGDRTDTRQNNPQTTYPHAESPNGTA